MAICIQRKLLGQGYTRISYGSQLESFLSLRNSRSPHITVLKKANELDYEQSESVLTKSSHP